MRVIGLLIKYTLTIVVGGAVLGLITREILLYWGIQQVKTAENKMELIAGAKFLSEYDKECSNKSSGRSGAGVRVVQLRFTSSTEYQVEVVCDYFTNDPIVVQEYKLPMFVKKVSGQSGFVWQPQNTSGIVLEVFQRTASIILEGEKVKVEQGKKEIVGTQPEATCAGYGYACCSAETEVGTGSLFTRVTDCPADCYNTCVSRPTVLKFTSDPNPDLKSKTVRVGANAPITFYFVSDPGVAGQAISEIVFGDGQSQSFTEQEGNYTHQYACDQAECLYTATLVVKDATGASSVSTPVSTITVVVK